MARRLTLNVNGLVHNVTATLDTPLLYVLHNELHLHGPRFGCGLAQCGTCASIHACWSGCSAGADAVSPRCIAQRPGRPSSVVIFLPLTDAIGVTQERISLPSSSTEQAPHCARPQPKRGPCRWSSLCRT